MDSNILFRPRVKSQNRKSLLCVCIGVRVLLEGLYYYVTNCNYEDDSYNKNFYYLHGFDFYFYLQRHFGI